ncbi:MAG TPA: hypothetical protein VHX62_05850 [Solirubrobacteraceae bacterium]|nr:hypothetical protein [Solirubrobacteraceae bacterium]
MLVRPELSTSAGSGPELREEVGRTEQQDERDHVTADPRKSPHLREEHRDPREADDLQQPAAESIDRERCDVERGQPEGREDSEFDAAGLQRRGMSGDLLDDRVAGDRVAVVGEVEINQVIDAANSQRASRRSPNSLVRSDRRSLLC